MKKSPLLNKYLKQYEKNPESRVFAPLAEAYRKDGQIDEALLILKNGIRLHPDYIMGHVGLAACYHDCEQDQLAYGILRPLVNNNRDNIRMQKLFGSVCETIGHNEEALEVYKYLLFLNPKDLDIQSRVRELEFSQEETLLNEESGFKTESQLSGKPFEEDYDDWVRLDFKGDDEEEEDITENWNVQPLKEAIVEKEVNSEPEATSIEVESVSESKEQEDLEEATQSEPSAQEQMVTLTLVDLYMGQGYLTKAREILESFKTQEDPRVQEKFIELEELEAQSKTRKHTSSDKIEGHETLSMILDEKLGNEIPKMVSEVYKSKISDKFHTFLHKIQSRASEKVSK